jgi:hypothetical protein
MRCKKLLFQILQNGEKLPDSFGGGGRGAVIAKQIKKQLNAR